MSETIKIVPNLVWKYNYSSGFDVNQFKEYLNKEAELHQTEGDGGKSTAGHENGPHEWPCNADFMQWLYPKLEVAAKEWDLDYTDLVCTGSWTNIHVKGAHTLPHEHGSTSIVVSAYVKNPIDGGNIEFEQLLRDKWVAQSRKPKSTIHDYWREINVKTNDVLLFPGWLTHKTQASDSDEDRIVFTLNIEARNRNRFRL